MELNKIDIKSNSIFLKGTFHGLKIDCVIDSDYFKVYYRYNGNWIYLDSYSYLEDAIDDCLNWRRPTEESKKSIVWEAGENITSWDETLLNKLCAIFDTIEDISIYLKGMDNTQSERIQNNVIFSIED